MRHSQTILAMNAGSSSVKLHLYEMGAGEQLLLRGALEGAGQDEGRLWFVDGGGATVVDRRVAVASTEAAVELVLHELGHLDLPSIEGVGHRVVHGGPDHLAPELATAELIDDLRRYIAWAPLHMPVSLRVIAAMRGTRPELPQVVCFDTAFHARIPEVARRLPVPRELYDLGVRKYGFHGLSYEYVLGVLGQKARGRVIVAHLGNGASIVACLDGRPIDTTMGMTPIGGIMMGTRSGDLDPGVLLFLMRERGLDADDLERLLDAESGLKGVSGQTADMRTLLELRVAGHQHAAQAIDMYCYRVRATIGALAAVLGGIDRLVFTGGIGENSAEVREQVCRGLGHLGIATGVRAATVPASAEGRRQGACEVLVVYTNEDLMIARHTSALVAGGSPSSHIGRSSSADF